MIRTFIIYLFCGISALAATSHPVPTNGVLDLRGHQFVGKESIDLTGTWLTLPGKIWMPGKTNNDSSAGFVPNNLLFDWSDYSGTHDAQNEFGSSTYRLKIYMPDNFPQMALRFSEVHSAYDLFVNGKLNLKNGNIGNSQQTSSPRLVKRVVNVDFHSGLNTMTLVVSNYHHHEGGITGSIELGPAQNFQYVQRLEIGSLLFLAGGLLVAGTFALGLFWFKPTDISGLLFFFFCCSYTYWLLNCDFHLIQSLLQGYSWVNSLRQEYIALALSVIFYTYFVKVMLEDFLRSFAFHIVAIISALVAIVVLLTPSEFFTQYIFYYYAYLGITFLVYSILALNAFQPTHKLDWVNALGIVAIISVFVHKVLVHYLVINEVPLFNNIGNCIFIFSQTIAMAISFGRKYREQSQAALQAVETRDEFLNTMSHELKTPMNAILGMSTFLENSELSKAQKAKLHSIKNNAESLMAMITDILSISEVGAGKINLNKGVFNLEAVLHSALVLSKQNLKQDNVRFSYSIEDSVPETMVGDASRIKQVILHLLNDVFKNTLRGVIQLNISAKQLSEGNINIKFHLRKRGESLSKNSSTHLFSFFNDLRPKSSPSAGTDFVFIEELVRQMGGEVHINHLPNGDLMTFNLVLEEFDKSAREQVASLFQRNEIDHSLKIMYAEDNPVNQKLVEMMLKSMGLEVDMADNGAEAVQMATKKYYNIILMDLQMPEMDGFEASRRIIANSRLRPIIIAVTANLAELDRHKCFEVGMNDFITKPLSQEELKLAIIKWQGLKQYLDDSSEGKTFKMSS